MNALLLLLAACAPEVLVEVGVEDCADWGIDEVLDPAPLAVDLGCEVTVARPGRAAPCGGAFAPILEADGRTLHVFEDWTGGDTACSACAVPLVRLVQPSEGTWEVQWFDDPDHASPAEIATFDAP